MPDIALRGELWDNDSADILRFFGWRDITAPMDIQSALEEANGEDVTVLINSPGGDMAVGNEIRSMLRRYKGKTTALFQGFGASAATLAAAGCTEIVSEPGALLCYHNPAGTASGDYREMAGASKGLKNARDCVLEVYGARPGLKATREELIALMDQDIFISPSKALTMGLIDSIMPMDEDEETDPAAFVAASSHRIRITESMREKYRNHVAEETAQRERETKAKSALARLRALAEF